MHERLLSSTFIQTIPQLLELFHEFHPIMFGIVGICRNLSQSGSILSVIHDVIEIGRNHLRALHILNSISAILSTHGTDVILCRNVLSIIYNFSLYGRSFLYFIDRVLMIS